MSNNVLRANRSLANFVILIVFGVVVTLFLVKKANQVIAEFSELERIQVVE